MNYHHGKAETSVRTAPPSPSLIQRKGLLLIDDDEFFRSLFEAIAASRGIPAEAYASLAELPSFAGLKDYDVAIFDYYLEAFRGPEIAEYVDVFFSDLPVLMISGGDVDAKEQQSWPNCIRSFVPKAAGPYAIIDRAIAALSGSAQGCSSKKVANLN